MEAIWCGVNDTSAVDFCGDRCNKKITKASKKTSRIASGLPLDGEKSSLVFISLIYIKHAIYRLGETFFPMPLKTPQNSSLNPTRRFKTLKNA